MPCRPAIDAMLTMEPLPAASIAAPSARESRNGPVRFTSSTRRHCSAVVSSAGRSSEIPALLTSTSTRPYSASTRFVSSAAYCSEATSPVSANAAAPCSRTAARVSAGSRRSASTVAYPRSASASATRRPIPCAEPVTTATAPTARCALTDHSLPSLLLGRFSAHNPQRRHGRESELTVPHTDSCLRPDREYRGDPVRPPRPMIARLGQLRVGVHVAVLASQLVLVRLPQVVEAVPQAAFLRPVHLRLKFEPCGGDVLLPRPASGHVHRMAGQVTPAGEHGTRARPQDPPQLAERR